MKQHLSANLGDLNTSHSCRDSKTPSVSYLMEPSTWTLLVMTYWLPEVTPRVLAGMLLLAELRVRAKGPLPK